MRQPLIVDVKRGSRDDGPGTRSVVFFKGCPLRCVFCQNPETHDASVEIAFRAQRCIECGRCEDACPSGAAMMRQPGRILRSRCTRCGACTEVCPGGALRRAGRAYTPQGLAELLLRDRPFYSSSGGGVTLSGGEPTLFPRFVQALLRILKAEGVHVVLETCGYFDYATFRRAILPYVDLIYYDIKFADPRVHQTHTGRDNRRILANLRQLLREGGVIVEPRVPLVPDITATAANLGAIAHILQDMGARSVRLLPYNPLGLDMWGALGRASPPLPRRFMRPEELADLQHTFERLLHDLTAQPISEMEGGTSRDRVHQRHPHDGSYMRDVPSGASGLPGGVPGPCDTRRQ